MSAYTRAYSALAKTMPATEAAELLAELRQETGRELAATLRTYAHEEHQADARDSLANARKKRVRHGAVARAAAHLEQITGNRPTVQSKHQRSAS